MDSPGEDKVRDVAWRPPHGDTHTAYGAAGWVRCPPVRPDDGNVNSEHQQLCSSPEWAEHLQTDVLPRLAAGVDFGADMLEFGPGPGAATEWLCQRVDRLTALEKDESAAGLLARKFQRGNVAVVVGDCADLGFPDESFDSVACFTMLHHAPTTAVQQAMLAEAFRVLRPQGVFIGSDSIGSSELHQFHAGDTYNPVDPARLLIQLQTVGFHDVTISVRDNLTFVAHKPAASADEPVRDPLARAAAAMPLAAPLSVEEPREGDPGGASCTFCALTDDDTVWSNTHWRMVPRRWSPLAGGMLLLRREHIDALAEMDQELQQEFGVLAAAIERAILTLGGVARVHLYRWGDGRAHFHAHFVPRPYGRPQFGWRNLPFLEERLPSPGDERIREAAEAVGRALRGTDLPK